MERPGKAVRYRTASAHERRVLDDWRAWNRKEAARLAVRLGSVPEGSAARRAMQLGLAVRRRIGERTTYRAIDRSAR